MKADNIIPLLFKLISYSIFRVFSIAPLSEESSNFRKVLLVFLASKIFFNLPIVLETDFKILKIMKNLQNITPWLKLSKSPLKKLYNYVLF